MRRASLLSGSILAAGLIAVSATACAQEAREFNIPAGTLRDGLNLFATQSDQQILFSGEAVDGLKTQGLRGRHAPSAALDRLLGGTGLAWSETRPGVIFLRRSDGGAVVDRATVVDDVVVTGTLLKASGELASPVVMLDRDELDRRGRGTVADVLAELPQNYAGSGTAGALLSGADRGGSNGVVATGVNLRGLGTDATLVLINGRRMAGTGFRGEFADVSALPSAAVERVDVLLDGASALYGSDAVAGVINIIMRRSFDGQESRVRLSAAEGGMETVIASHLAGRSWSSGSALLSYEYQRQNALSSLDRAYTADGDLRPFGGSDWRTLFSSPGNIVAYDPARASYVSQWAIRPGPSGTAQTPADFAAGQTNLQATSQGVDLMPDIERHSVYGRLRQSMGDRLDLTADLRFNRRTYGFANTPGGTVIEVTSANPWFVSPSGAASHTLAYSFSGDLGASRQSGSSRSLGFTAGAAVDLGRGWSADAYLAWAEERGQSRISGQVNSLFLEEALGNRADNPATAYAAARDGYFNPFGAGAANGAAVLDFIGSGYSGNLDRSRARSVNLLIEGPLFALPGGEVQLALGVQARGEDFQTRSTVFLSTLEPVTKAVPKQDRVIAAIFAETRLPLVGPANARPGVRALELSLAGRVEDYDDFGTTANPKLGIVWSPTEGLNMRASWGTSFRAPALTQIHDAPVAGASLVPRADGSRMLAVYLTGGNPDLEPETAETWTAGFDYRPENGLVLSASYFDTRFEDRIERPTSGNLANILTDPALAPFVRFVDAANSAEDKALVESYIRAPGFGFGSQFPASTFGAVLDGRWVNTAAVRVRGLDLSTRYPMDLGQGVMTVDASASWLLDYEVQMTPTAVVRSVLDRVGYPTSLRLRAGATWTMENLAASLHWSHVSDYADSAGARIGAWNTADLMLTWRPSAGRLEGVNLSAGVQNLFDADPPFYNGATGYGFDAGQANQLGRVVSLQLIRRW
ncbi:TonB-dependent receptor [Brevundimonas faecalis]|jgi:iron complex outermembrane recepter protein|nr:MULTISPECIES: TonB-dependent receptor [Brevundimonas]